jgi:hypothetical protein
MLLFTSSVIRGIPPASAPRPSPERNSSLIHIRVALPSPRASQIHIARIQGRRFQGFQIVRFVNFVSLRPARVSSQRYLAFLSFTC